MSDMDHRAEADKCIRAAHRRLGDLQPSPDLIMAQAQVHASLAVAEQLRIANLLKFVLEPEQSNLIGRTVTAGQVMAAQKLIREGLGL